MPPRCHDATPTKAARARLYGRSATRTAAESAADAVTATPTQVTTGVGREPHLLRNPPSRRQYVLLVVGFLTVAAVYAGLIVVGERTETGTARPSAPAGPTPRSCT